MKKIIWMLLVMSALVVALTASASAAEFQEASGDWCYIPTTLEERTAGGNLFMHTSEEATWTGTFEGTSKDDGYVFVHKTGFWLFRATVYFPDVTVNGKSGELFLRAKGSRPDGMSEWAGSWVITGGTGELKGLRGKGTVSGIGYTGDPPDVPGCVSYEGTIHFEP